MTPWTVTCQAPLALKFSRQEYWSGLLFPLPGDLPNPGTKPAFLVSPALAGYFTTSATWEALNYDKLYQTLALCIQGDLKEERGYFESILLKRGEDRWNSPVKNTGLGWEGGFRMGNTCKSMADSCQCMAKTTTIL